jgi:hypothetical protein
MTPQERTMLSDLLARVESTQLAEKDSEAEDLLRQRLGQSPEQSLHALYVLAQTVLVQNYALEQAKAQIEQLKHQAATQQATSQPAKATSFLGGLFGHKDEQQAAPRPAAPPPAAPPAYAAAQQQSYPPAGGGYPPAYGAPQGYPPASQGGGSSFLRSAATTAAGVAAGALAFEGIESLMHGFGHSAGFGGGEGFMGGPGMGGPGMGGPGMGGETVINNYYDSPAGGPGGGDSGADRLADLQSTAQQGDAGLTPETDLADDASVQGGDLSQQPMDLADADVDDGSSDLASVDDGNGFDDGSTFDDGGGDDSSFG